MFKASVLARIIEPTSKLYSVRVLGTGMGLRLFAAVLLPETVLKSQSTYRR